jgi:hypothetical protein
MNKSELVRAIHQKMDQKITLKDIEQMVDVMLSARLVMMSLI